MIKRILAPLASLKLTVVLLSLSLVLVFAGTWAQIDRGIWQVQAKYFHSLFVWMDFSLFLPRTMPEALQQPGTWNSIGRGTLDVLGRIRVPMIGGYLLGILLLANLLAAHALRFKFTKKRIGVILIHLGLILLIVGEGVTSHFALETQMAIEEGSSANYTQDIREAELAVIDSSPADHDDVTSIPASRLETGATVRDPKLPFDVQVDQYFPNSDLVRAGAEATAVLKDRDGNWMPVERPVVSGTVDAEKVDRPSAVVTLTKDGQKLGTLALSSLWTPGQEVKVGEKTYKLALRFKRYYKPYTVKLIDFRHDRYPGTNVPKNYSSQIRLTDLERGDDREVIIRMNEPLRYRGDTFFQASFVGETVTILQVVDNPGWVMPYVACVVGALGLLIHFGQTLVGFIRKEKKRTAAAAAPPVRQGKAGKGGQADAYTLAPVRWWASARFLFPAVVTGLCAMYVLAHAKPAPKNTAYDLERFGQIPVSYEGRVQPLDSVARNSLKVMLGRESFRSEEGKRTRAVQWLLDLMANRGEAQEHDVFRIDHPEVLDVIGLVPKREESVAAIFGMAPSPYRFSIDDMRAKFSTLEQQIQAAAGIAKDDRTPYQHKLIELGDKLNQYIKLSQVPALHLIPPASGGGEWETVDASGRAARSGGEVNPALKHALMMLDHYRKGETAAFNAEVAAYHAHLDKVVPADMARARFETFFNRFDPFTNSLVLYVFVFILAALSWLGWSGPLQRAAFWLLALSFVVHTLGLAGRVYISGRPPVTNLASSAIFIAWGVVALAGATELFFRNAISTVMAAVAGFLSLLIAYKLSMEGDTMKVLQAVLDTNFWLATHVIIITLGYSATFLAGFVGIAYILGGFFTKRLTPEGGKNLTRMTYGITCFALLFSFVGTVLGGIWADQSWGRFWGWDPKENGAVMIVLANALLLHARWGGIVKERGIASLAVFGNIITAWSWFGTNMLGVGLHSYGFMESALFWLSMFVLSQGVFMVIAALPANLWRSKGAVA